SAARDNNRCCRRSALFARFRNERHRRRPSANTRRIPPRVPAASAPQVCSLEWLRAGAPAGGSTPRSPRGGAIVFPLAAPPRGGPRFGMFHHAWHFGPSPPPPRVHFV